MDEIPFYCNWCRVELGRIAPGQGLLLRPDAGMSMKEVKDAIKSEETGEAIPIVRLTCPECNKLNMFLLGRQRS